MVVVVVGGMWANTETSRSSARARAATTMSIKYKDEKDSFVGWCAVTQITRQLLFHYNLYLYLMENISLLLIPIMVRVRVV